MEIVVTSILVDMDKGDQAIYVDTKYAHRILVIENLCGLATLSPC